METPMPDSITTILYRLETVEKSFQEFKNQLQSYETTRENDLKFRENEAKLQLINATASRIEIDLRAVKSGMDEIKIDLLLKENESIKRDAATRASQDKLQIKVLVGILTTVVGVITTLFIFYVTHK